MDRRTLIAIVALVSGTVQGAAAQRTHPEAPAETAGINVAARIGGKKFQGSGTGECRHESEASIHGVSAALWMVHFAGRTGSVKQLDLTLWRPKDGSPDQLSVSVETGS